LEKKDAGCPKKKKLQSYPKIKKSSDSVGELVHLLHLH